MSVRFPGRVEALIKVPTGGASVSASTGALTNAVTVTVPAGSYFPTAAGTTSGLLETLEDELNENARQYPENAAALQAAIGYGTWTSGAGWLMQEASGSLAAAFGSPSLTAVSSPTYQNAGPAAGKYAVGFNSADDAFDGSTNFGLAAGDDLIVAWVAKIDNSSARDMISRWGIPANPGVWIVRVNASGVVNLYVNDGVDEAQASTAALPSGWHVGIAVLERATSRLRVAVRTLAGASDVSAEVNTAAIGAVNGANPFRLGANGLHGSADGFALAAAYIATGSGVATGLSANLSTALTNFANAINSSWSVSLSTTDGRITAAHSFWPSSIDWTSTTLRDVLGFEYDFSYPQTAAAVTEALGGYGDFTSGAGYLCDEASGDLSSTFGSPATLTASGSPSYSNVGGRGGGNDKAIGFTGVNDSFAGSTTDFNISAATTDLIYLWVASFSSAPNGTRFIGKGTGSVGAWLVTSASGIRLTAINGSTYTTGDVAVNVGEHHAGIAVIDRGTGKMRIATQGLTSSTQNISSEVTVGAVAFSNANAWKIGDWGGGGSTSTNSTYSCVYVATGVGVASGLSANLSSALSSFVDSLSTQSGTTHARGVWLPDCPLKLAGNPRSAPSVTDLRQSESPTGVVLGLAGNRKYRHKGIIWPAVPIERVWEDEAEYAYASWESFLIDAQYGMGHSWFTPSSRVQIIWDDAGTPTLIGQYANAGEGTDGWYMKGLTSVEPEMTSPPWTGLWKIEIPEIVTDG